MFVCFENYSSVLNWIYSRQLVLLFNCNRKFSVFSKIEKFLFFIKLENFLSFEIVGVSNSDLYAGQSVTGLGKIGE
jgi:hypothetical protein